MAQLTTGDGRDFADRIEENKRRLSGFARRGRLASGVESARLLPGEFRSRRRITHGLERDVPRTFVTGDDPSYMDLRALHPLMFLGSIADAIAGGHVRLTQAVQFVESEFILITDCSQSALEGCFGQGPIAKPADVAVTTLGATYYATAAFVTLAESMRFAIRQEIVEGDRISELRARNPQDFLPRALAAMNASLQATYSRCEAAPNWSHRSPFLLGAALTAVCAVRVPSVVVVISDFLDPCLRGGYAGPLAEVLGRHRVLLVDVCAARYVPEPTLLEIDARSTPLREVARHLELGTEPRPVTARAVREWNAARQDNEQALDKLCRRFGASRRSFVRRDYTSCYLEALEWLRSLR